MWFRRYDHRQINTHRHRQTDTLITILRSLIGGGVITEKHGGRATGHQPRPVDELYIVSQETTIQVTLLTVTSPTDLHNSFTVRLVSKSVIGNESVTKTIINDTIIFFS